MKIERQKTKKMVLASPRSDRGLNEEDGRGNEIEYDESNVVKINYEDVDGDGFADTKVVNADEEVVEYKTQGSVFIK